VNWIHVTQKNVQIKGFIQNVSAGLYKIGKVLNKQKYIKAFTKVNLFVEKLKKKKKKKKLQKRYEEMRRFFKMWKQNFKIEYFKTR
jgi:hypothetical protein